MRRVGVLLVAGLLVAGCSGGLVGGLRWERVDDPSFGERVYSEGGERLRMYSVASSGSLLVAVGSEGNHAMDAAAWVSPYGTAWSRADVPAPDDEYSDEEMLGVASVDGGFTAYGWAGHVHDSVLWYSPDGYGWQRLPGTVLGDADAETEIQAMAAAGPGLVAVGTTGQVAAIWVSETGRDWERIPHDEGTFGRTGTLWEVVPFHSGVIVFGRIDGELSMLRSADGNAWERVPLGGDDVFGDGWRISRMVAGGPGLIAVGSVLDDPAQGTYSDSDAAIWVSTDGVSWERIPPNESMFGGPECQGIRTAVAGDFGVVAFGGTDPCNRDQALPGMHNRVWFSTDGYRWERVPHDDGLWGDGAVGANQPITDAVTHEGNVLAVGFWVDYTFGESPPDVDPSLYPEIEDMRFGGRVWIGTPIGDD